MQNKIFLITCTDWNYSVPLSLDFFCRLQIDASVTFALSIAVKRMLAFFWWSESYSKDCAMFGADREIETVIIFEQTNAS